MSSNAPTFTWHPDFRGRTVEEVEHEIAESIRRDQRSYELALSAAEQDEHGALNAVRDIERRWSAYSLDWAEADPSALAHKVVELELERDRRQEMVPIKDIKTLSSAVTAPSATPTATKVKPYVAVAALGIVAIIVLVWVFAF